MHGYPDWGVSAPKKTVFSLQDMAELAARLGSIVTFDRRGDVFWLDDFEDNINKYSPPASGVAYLSAEACRSGGFSAKLTTGPNLGDNTGIGRVLPYLTKGKLGFESSFALVSSHNLIWMLTAFHDGATVWRPRVQYNQDDNILEIRTGAAAYTTIASGLDLAEDKWTFHTWKLVCDYATGKYTRLILNETAHDLSGYDMFSEASTFAPEFYIEVKTQTLENASQIIHVDDIIVTQNEL